jgi:cytochrome P450
VSIIAAGESVSYPTSGPSFADTYRYLTKTYATVLTFIMVMALNPEKQKVAHAEMDAVLASTGSNFPNFTHKPSLPYLDAVIKETMRWHPALPLSMFIHRCREEAKL